MAIGLALIALASVIAEPAQAVRVCSRIWKPVCAVKNGTAKTYSNATCATADGATVVVYAPCIHRGI
jgi:hypothetical protein